MHTSGRPRVPAVMLGLLCLAVTACAAATSTASTEASPALVTTEVGSRSTDSALAPGSVKDRWRDVTQDLGFGDRYKDVVVDTVMPLNTDDPITLYWKGPAPAEVTDALEKSGLDVVIRDDQPYSQTDFTAMQAKIHEALLDVGYEGLSSGVKYSDSGPILEVNVPSDVEPNWSREQILDLLSRTVPDGAMTYIELNTENIPLPRPA